MASWFVFSPDADHERMSLHHPRHVEHFERGLTGGDDGTVGKGNPLALILTEELVADSPVVRLVLAPVGMDLSSDFGGQLVGNAFHATPRVNSDSPRLYSTSEPLPRRDRSTLHDPINHAIDLLPERE
jgi:hypothetical protein